MGDPIKMPENGKGHYTYADYLTWPEGERWELINGVPFNMSPAPKRKHQELLTQIFGRFWEYLKEKPCDLYVAPFDIRLIDKPFINDEEVITVVQPDLVVYCDKNRLDDRGGIGAPDLLVEILSPSTAYRDMDEKFKLYEANGVREYWVVAPEGEFIQVFTLNEKRFSDPQFYRADQTLTSGIFDGLELDLSGVFQNLKSNFM